MTVRTEKIQALTGSAPLTLPTSLPANSKAVEVSTTGVITTPATADSLSHLTSSTGSDTGWVLLDHNETNSGTDVMSVRNTSTIYPPADIYCYELQFHLQGYYSNTAGNMRWSPTRGGTRSPNGSGRYSVGVYQGTGSGKSNYSVGSNSTSQSTGYENNMSYKRNGQSSPTGNKYEVFFDKDTAAMAGNYAGDGGIQGKFRYYNGAGYSGCIIDDNGYNGRGGSGNSYTDWSMNRCGFSMPVNNDATYTAAVDGFDVFDSNSISNTNYQIFGFVQLWGMPKAVS